MTLYKLTWHTRTETVRWPEHLRDERDVRIVLGVLLRLGVLALAVPVEDALCEHGTPEGELCEPCEAVYKAAAASPIPEPREPGGKS